MVRLTTVLIVFWSILMLSMPAVGADTDPADAEGTIFTLWPLIDYRSSPKEGFSNLGILGPLIKIQQTKDVREVAVRPLFHTSGDEKQESRATDYLYPLASSETTPEVSRYQFLQIFQTSTFRKDEVKEDKKGEDFDMFFPFYISGTSQKYGPFTSVFPIYGDLYERLWRDEYHYVLFPLYGKTVKDGTTSTNYLYPFFNRIEGDKESGGHFWPLYGQSAKEGVYSKRFVLWPFYMQETSGLNTDNPKEKLYMIPFYTSIDSPDLTARGWVWPFFGYSDDRKKRESRVDYLWPFWWTIRGENRNATSFLPFYQQDTQKDSSKRWVLWPIYKTDLLENDAYSQERHRVLFFLFQDRLELWKKDGSERRRTSLWPLFMYKRDYTGMKSFTLPALIEPIVDREGIDNNWAPLWRLYVHKWNDSGESALSILWNLYWHENRRNSSAWELFPLVSHREAGGRSDTGILKGFVRYQNGNGRKKLSFLWLPFGFEWGEEMLKQKSAAVKDGEGL